MTDKPPARYSPILQTKFFRWFAVGVLSATVDNLLFLLLVASSGVLAGNWVSGSVAFFLNFGMNQHFVFDAKGKSLQSLVRFLISFLIERSFNTCLVLFWLFLGLNHLEAKLISTALQTPLSYLLNLRFVFAQREKTGPWEI